MPSWRSYEGSFESLNATLGKIPLKEFQHKDLHRYVAQRKKQVKPATVNRAIAAISKLFSYALECGEIDTHPLVRFPKLKEPKKVFRPLTVQQFRDLVEAVDVRTVQKLMGHSAISTTMRYAGYVSSHALASIRLTQATEDSQTQQATNRQRVGNKGQ